MRIRRPRIQNGERTTTGNRTAPRLVWLTASGTEPNVSTGRSRNRAGDDPFGGEVAVGPAPDEHAVPRPGGTALVGCDPREQCAAPGDSRGAGAEAHDEDPLVDVHDAAGALSPETSARQLARGSSGWTHPENVRRVGVRGTGISGGSSGSRRRRGSRAR